MQNAPRIVFNNSVLKKKKIFTVISLVCVCHIYDNKNIYTSRECIFHLISCALPLLALSVVISAHRMKWRRFGYLKVKKKNERGISFLWLIEEKTPGSESRSDIKSQQFMSNSLWLGVIFEPRQINDFCS
jgi:hypothetical protein